MKSWLQVYLLKVNLIYAFGLGILCLTGCGPTCVVLRSTDARLESAYDRGKIEGERIGEEKGYLKGREDGEKAGLASGIDKGKVLGMKAKEEQLYHRYKDDYASMQKEAVIALTNEMNSFKAGHAKLALLIKDSTLSSPTVLNALKEAFRTGYQWCYDSIHHVSVRKGQFVTPVETDYEIQLDYDEIAQSLHSMRGSENAYYDSYEFSKQVASVHTQVMNYLSERLSLERTEVDRMKSEYQLIHDYVSEIYYRRYKAITDKIYQHQQKPFYDYTYYRSVDVFIDVINSGLCSVMDVVLTFAKSNSQYANVVGLEGMGHLCQILQEEVMTNMEERLIRNSLIYDYDEHGPLLRQHTITINKPIRVDKYIQEKEITRNIYLDDGASASIDMTIHSMVDLGMDLSDALVEVQHNCQRIIIHLPAEPYKIDMAHQWYSIKDMDVTFKYEKKLEIYKDYAVVDEGAIPFPNPSSETVPVWAEHNLDIPGDELSYIFDSNKPSIDQIVNIPPLEESVLGVVKPILRKIYEQPVALEASCYNVYIYFRGKMHPLIEFDCNPGCYWSTP